MKKQKKIKRPTQTQLRFVWVTINELQAFLNAQIEKGARGVTRYSNDATKAKRIIQNQRLFNYKTYLP